MECIGHKKNINGRIYINKSFYKIRNISGFKKNKWQKYVKVRSKWEEDFIYYLESNNNVKEWSYDFPIKYFDAYVSKRTRTYFIDFYVKMINNKVLLIEIKPLKFLESKIKTKSLKFKAIYNYNYLKNKSKFIQADKFAKSKGWEFYIVGKHKNSWKFIKLVI